MKNIFKTKFLFLIVALFTFVGILTNVSKQSVQAAKLAPIITYETDGGTTCDSIPSNTIKFPEEDPEKENYLFAGWYLDSTFNTMAQEGANIYSDTTLYAKWGLNTATLITGIQALKDYYGSSVASKANNMSYFEISDSDYYDWLGNANAYLSALNSSSLTLDTYLQAKSFYESDDFYETLSDWDSEIESYYGELGMLLVYITDQYNSAITALNAVLTVNGTDALNNCFLSSFLYNVNQFKSSYLQYAYLNSGSFKDLMGTGKYSSDRDVSYDIIDDMDSDSQAILELVREVEISTDANSKGNVNGVYDLGNSSSKTFNVDNNFALSVTTSFNDGYKLSIIINDIPGSSTNNNVFSGTITDTSLVSIISEIAGYTISYESNCSTTYENVTSDKIVLPETNPTKVGYYFDGWFTDSTFDVKAVADTSITENTTLYASFTKVIITEPNKDNDYKVVVNENLTDITYQWYKYVASTIDVKDSTEIELWGGTYNTEDNTYSSVFSFVTHVIRFKPKAGANVDITKIWIQYTYNGNVYTVQGLENCSKGNPGVNIPNLNGDGTAFTISNVKVLKYVGVELTDETDDKLGTTTLENTSYYCEVIKDSEVIATSGTIKPNTITFNGNDATSGTVSPIYQLEGRKITLPACTFIKTDYMFNGWSYNSNKYVQGISYTIGSTNIEFSAIWITPHKCNDYTYEVELTNESIKGYITTEYDGNTPYDVYKLPSGNYYLGEDICLKYNLFFNIDSILCLNGHILSFEYCDNYINADYLEIYDCKHNTGSHNYLVNTDSAWSITTKEATTDINSLSTSLEEENVVSVTGGAIITGYINSYSVKLKNVNLIGLNNGVVACNVDAINCNFYGNYIIAANGSCINGGYINLYNSTFMYNVTESLDGVGGQGAIFCTAKLLVNGCTIKYNTADSGAGIFLDNESTIATIINTTITNNKATINGAGVCFDSPATCLLKGTLITMSDDSTKAIENVKVGDKVKSLNHETGLYESNKVIYVYASQSFEDVITLKFEGEKTLSIVGVHGLFCKELNKYVTIDSDNYNTFVGKNFYDATSNTWVELLEATCEADYVTYYSVYVAKTSNCIANNLLTCPDDVLYMVNIYDFTTDNYLKANATTLASDITTYGLFDFSNCNFVQTLEEFNDYNGKYYNIYLGKGLLTERAAEDLYYEGHNYDQYISGIEGPALVIGNNVTIKNNYVDDKEENVYLSDGVNVYVIDGATNINVGITMENIIGDFAFKVYSKNIGFSSDNNQVNIIKTKTNDTYTYSLSYIMEQPNKDNDYTVGVNDNLKDDVTYQWYQYKEIKKSDLTPTTVCDDFTTGDYEATSLTGYYELNIRFNIKYLIDGAIFKYKGTGSFYDELGDDGYYTHQIYASNAVDNTYFFVLIETYDDVEINITDFIIVDKKALTGETNAKLGNTTLTDATYFCEVYKDGTKIETSNNLYPHKISFDYGNGQTLNMYQLEGRKITLPSTGATKFGYKLSGWKLDSNTYELGSNYTVTADATFTTAWKLAESIDIYNFDDLWNARVLYNQAPDGYTVTWEIKADFTVEKRIVVEKKGIKLTINGNNHTLTAEQDGTAYDHVFDIVAYRSMATSFTMNNLNIVVKDGFIHGIAVQKNSNAGVRMEATLNNVNITLNHSKQPINSKNVEKTAAAIINNDSIVNLKGNCTFTLDKYGRCAVDLDNTNREAELNVDSNAVIIVKDNRTLAQKAIYPVVNKDNATPANGFTVTNIDKVHADTSTGNILVSFTNGTKTGYNFKATVQYVTNYSTTVDDLVTTTQAKVTNPGLVREGYYFNGWFVESTFKTKWDLDNDLVQGDMKLYASWKEKTAVSITETAQTYTYNGQSQGFVITGNVTTDFTVKYYVDGAWTTTAPTNVESYKVLITRAEDDNYKVYEKEIVGGLLIQKYAVTITKCEDNFTYNGQDQSSSLTAYYYNENNTKVDLVLVQCLKSGFKFPVAFNDAGEYVVLFKFNTTLEANNYSYGTANLTKIYTMKQKEVDITWENKSYTYNGQELTTPTATYKDLSNTDIALNVTMNKTIKNAGSYVATASFKNNETNYKLPTTVTKEYVVNKAQVVKPSADTTTFTYSGNVQTYTITTNNLYTISNNTRTNAGSQTVTVALNDKDNYCWSDKTITDLTFSFTINKANASITVDQTAIVKTYGETVTIPTATTNFGTVSCDKVSNDLVNAGTYTITYTVTGTDNYNGDTKTINVTINKANASITVDQTAIVKTYGETVTIPTATTNFGTLSCDKVATDLVNVGTYTITYTVTGTDNFNGDTKTVSVTINKLGVSEPTVTGTYTYTGNVQTVSLNGVKSFMSTTDVLTGTNVDTYTINYSLDNNHKWNTGSDGVVTWTISKADALIIVDQTAIVKTYGETVIVPTATTNFGTVSCDKVAADLVNVGTYTITYTVTGTDNFNGDTKTINVTINKLGVNEPTVIGSYKYTGVEQTVQLSGVESYMSTTNSLSATNVGTYRVIYTLDNNHKWNIGSDGIINWEIKPLTITPVVDPTQGENDKNDVIVSTDEGFSNNITVTVEVTVEVEIESKTLAVNYYDIPVENARLLENEKVGVVFDVKLIQTIGGRSQTIQPEDIAPGTIIKVKMLIPESVDITKVTRILHVHSASDIETIEFNPLLVDENGYYEIEVSRLSEFAFIYEKDDECIVHWFILALTLIFLVYIAFLWFVLNIKTFKNEKGENNSLAIVGFTMDLALLIFIGVLAKCMACLALIAINAIILVGITILYVLYKEKQNN